MSELLDCEGNILVATDEVMLLDTGVVPFSQDDFVRRLRYLLPTGWFPSPPSEGETEGAPVLYGVISGFGAVLTWVWTLFQAASQQARIATASDGFLDMIADDFLGQGVLPRLSGESDNAYRSRIISSLVAPRNTRVAVATALAAVTGITPIIIEPWRAQDCHARGSMGVPAAGGGYGYGTEGLRYGSLGGGAFFVETGTGGALSMSVVRSAITQTKAQGVIGWLKVIS
jgi:hypothetical protein